MLSTPEPTCGDCKFFREIKIPPSFPQRNFAPRGYCLRYPPHRQPVEFSHDGLEPSGWQHPIVCPSLVACGEFQHRVVPQPEKKKGKVSEPAHSSSDPGPSP
jgi:hypothetical protein